MHLGLSTEDRGFNLSLLICTRCDEFTVRFARTFAQPTRVRHRQAVRAAKVSGQPTTHGSPRQLLCPSHVPSPHTWIEFGLQRCIHFCYTDFTIVDWPVALPGCGAEVAEYLHPNTTFSFVLFRFLRHHRCRLASSVEVDDDELRLPVLRGCLFAVWPFANGVEVHITNDGPLSWGMKHHLHYRLASILFYYRCISEFPYFSINVKMLRSLSHISHSFNQSLYYDHCGTMPSSEQTTQPAQNTQNQSGFLDPEPYKPFRVMSFTPTTTTSSTSTTTPTSNNVQRPTSSASNSSSNNSSPRSS